MKLTVRSLMAVILFLVVGLWLGLRIYQQKTIEGIRESIAYLTAEASRDTEEVGELESSLKGYHSVWKEAFDGLTQERRRALRMNRQRFELVLRKVNRPDMEVLAKLYFEAAQSALEGGPLLAAREQKIENLYEQLLGHSAGLREIYGAKLEELERRGSEILKGERKSDLIFLGGSLAALVTVIAVIWSLVGAPLTQLAQGVRLLAKEQWQEPLPVKGFGEIADLIRAFNRMAHIIERQKELLVREATTDELTGLLNFRAFQDRIQQEIQRSRRLGKPLSLVLADIDWFKKFNDARGHLAGNEALKEIASRIRKGCRSYDIVARFGGEEFAVVLPETDAQGAWKLAERIRKKVSSDGFELTLSCGIATFPDEAGDLPDLIAKADRRLYAAKAQGRNRIVAAAS